MNKKSMIASAILILSLLTITLTSANLTGNVVQETNPGNFSNVFIKTINFMQTNYIKILIGILISIIIIVVLYNSLKIINIINSIIKKMFYSFHKAKDNVRLQKENITINQINKNKQEIITNAKKENNTIKEAKIEIIQKTIPDDNGGIIMNNEPIEKIDILINQTLETETLTLIRDNPNTTTAAIQDHLGITHAKTDKILDKLITEKKIDYKNKGYVTTINAQANFNKKEERTDKIEEEYTKKILKNTDVLTNNMKTENIILITTPITPVIQASKTVEPIRETNVAAQTKIEEKQTEKTITKTYQETQIPETKAKTNDTINENQIIQQLKEKYKELPTKSSGVRIECERTIARELSKNGTFSIGMIIRIMNKVWKLDGKTKKQILDDIELFIKEDPYIKHVRTIGNIKYFRFI